MKTTLALILFTTLLAGGCEQSSSKTSDATDTTTDTADATTDATADYTPTETTMSDGDVDIVAVVNGVKLPASRITIYAQTPAVAPEQRQQIIDNMIISEIVTQEAEKNGFGDKQSVRDELAVSRQAVLGRAYASDFLTNNPVDEERTDALYQELLKQMAGNQEYEVAHILVGSEEEATELLAEIKDNPSAFDQLAQEHSKDPGSAANGGKLGWVSATGLVPEFATAMQTLGKGETSAPVQTTYGWHIIRVDDLRELKAPELTAEMREQLSQRERAELLSEHIQSLREKAEVEIR